MFVIDNLSKLDIAMDDYNAQKDYVTALCDFAKANDSHVLLVAHMSKSRESGDKPMDAAMVKGSGSITDLVDNVLVWWRNKTKEEKIKKGIASEDVQSQPDGACSCQKQRNGEEEPYLPLWFDKESQQFLNHHWSRPRNYVHYSTQEDGNV
jgi:twinkle protein